MRTALLLALAALSLAGCDPPPQSKPLDENAANLPQAAPKQGKDRLPDAAEAYAPVAKARRAEDQIMDAKEKQDQEIDQKAN